MTISPSKTAILYELKGLDVSKTLKDFRVKYRQEVFLKFQQHGQEIKIPVKKSHDYLGTVISYRDAQALTLQKRLIKARGQYSMLRKTINSPRVIGCQHRFKIWQAGVVSSATYGLGSVGLNTTGHTKLRATTSRQARAIAHLPAHITHVSNAEVRERLGSNDVVEAIRAQAEAKRSSLAQLQASNPLSICVRPLALEQLDYVIHGLKDEQRPDQAAQAPIAPPPAAAQVKCDICGKPFKNLCSMRKHKTFVHKTSDRLKVTFNAAEHAEGVLPTCAFCHHKFDHWDGLKHHIELDRCTQSPWMQARRPGNGPSGGGKEARGHAQQAESPVDKPSHSHDAGQEAPNSTKEPPVREAPGIIALLQDKDWTSIPDSPYAEKLRQHCCICSRWIVDPTALKRHLKQAHKAIWATVHSELEKQCEHFKSHLIRDGICPYCQRTSYSRHFKQCNVIFQSAVIGILHQHGGAGERSDDVRPSAAGTGSPEQPAQPSGCGRLCEERPDTGQEGQNKERPAANQTSHAGRHASRNSQFILVSSYSQKRHNQNTYSIFKRYFNQI